MNVHEIRRYRMLTGLRNFGARHRKLFAPIALADQIFAVVDDAIATVDAHATSQASSRLEAREHTIAKAVAREALLEKLAAMRRTVRACSNGDRSVDSRFCLPRGVRDHVLVAAARAVARAAEPLERELVAHAMPVTVLDDLTTAIDEFEQTMHARYKATGAHVGARVGIETAVARGFAAVRRLDAIVANHLHDNPGVLAAWKNARRVERSRRSARRRLVPAVAVPEREPIARAHHRRTVTQQRSNKLHEIPRGMRSHLASRGGHRFAKDDDAADTLQRSAERDLLGDEQPLVEAARSLERGPRAEDVAPCRPAHHAHALENDEHREGSPPRLRSFDANRGAAADRTAVERHQTRAHDRWRNDGVGVDEDEHVARRSAGAGVAHARDLTMVAIDDAGAVRARDGAGCIGGRVVGDDDLVGECDVARGCVNSV
jgi:hypothetical protein